MGDWETRRLGDKEIRRLGDWEIWGFGDWGIGSVFDNFGHFLMFLSVILFSIFVTVLTVFNCF